MLLKKMLGQKNCQTHFLLAQNNLAKKIAEKKMGIKIFCNKQMFLVCKKVEEKRRKKRLKKFI